MARGKCRALRAVYLYLWCTLRLLIGGMTRHWLDDSAHFSMWSFEGVVNY